jgi:hypothetical protein
MLDETEAAPGVASGAPVVGAPVADATDADAAGTGADDALLSRLRLIEERPLDERADAYTRIHGELAEVLEGRDDQRQDD